MPIANKKTNKQKQKGKKSFFEVVVTGLGRSCIELVVISWPTGYSRFFLSSLSPVFPFLNVIAKKDSLFSSSMNARTLWSTSSLST